MFYFILTYLSTFFAIFHLVSSMFYKRRQRIFRTIDEKGISLIIPCFNEAKILSYTVEGISQLDYTNFDVIFVNDGSTDDTLQTLDTLLKLREIKNHRLDECCQIFISELYPNISVIDKENKGKASSLNIGAKFSQREIVVTLDGDCVLEKDALKIVNETFHERRVIACGGSIHIMQLHKSNEKQNLLIYLQALDLIKGFYIYKSSLAYHEALAIISGAFGAFDRKTLIEIGGFRKSLGEDIDITLRFQEYAIENNKKIIYQPHAICYTECPDRLSDLTKQRIRWQKGFIDALLKNKQFIFKNIFKNSVSFFIIIDALFSNTAAIFLFAFNSILLALNIIKGIPTGLFFYVIATILVNMIYSFVGLKKAKITQSNFPLIKSLCMILCEATFFRLLNIYYFVFGTLMYPFGHSNWNKFERTNNAYLYQPKLNEGAGE